MSHDLIAELAGYRAELANCERSGNNRVDAVRKEVERVEGLIRARVEQLKVQADNYATDGQDVLCAQALTEARRLARESGVGTEPGAAETAAESTPRETATPKPKKGA